MTHDRINEEMRLLPEKIRSKYGDNVNDFYKKFRDLMPDAFVSSVVVTTSPGAKPWKRKTTMDELMVLTKYVDQLSFLYYDTYIGSQPEFEENCVFFALFFCSFMFA